MREARPSLRRAGGCSFIENYAVKGWFVVLIPVELGLQLLSLPRQQCELALGPEPASALAYLASTSSLALMMSCIGRRRGTGAVSKRQCVRERTKCKPGVSIASNPRDGLIEKCLTKVVDACNAAQHSYGQVIRRIWRCLIAFAARSILLESHLQDQKVNLGDVAFKVTEVLADLILMAPRRTKACG